MTAAEINSIKPDYIVLVEFHRCGAEMWGQGVNMLLSRHSEVPVLGLSAAAILKRDMTDELFDGNKISYLFGVFKRLESICMNRYNDEKTAE